MPLLYPLLLSSVLFGVGLYGVLSRRNAVLALMGVELMLNAVMLDLVAFDVWLRDVLVTGQVFTLYVITLAAAEIGLGLAIVLRLFRAHATVDVDAVGGDRSHNERAHDDRTLDEGTINDGAHDDRSQRVVTP